MSPAGRAALVLDVALVANLAGNMSFQALIPTFLALWELTNSEAGWIAGVSFLSYAIASPLLTAATDRVDAQRVVLLGSAISALAGIGFALFAAGFWSALFWRLVAGIGYAGAYMPGLKALTDRTQGPGQGRLQSFYTASYSVGVALSLLVTGLLAEHLGWRWAFALTGVLAALGGLLVLVGLQPLARAGRSATPPGFAAVGAVLRERGSLGYILGYAGHCWELFGYRTWLVAFLTFAAARAGTAVDPGTIAVLATLALLLGLPASILGNEVATRFDRRRTLVIVLALSSLFGAGLGLLVALPFWLVTTLALLYGVLVMLDSAALTVGTLGSAPPERRGTTIAVQSLLGAIAAMVAPLAIGAILDLFGGDTLLGWGAAFATIAAGALFGCVTLWSLPPLPDARRRGSGRSPVSSRP